MNAIYYIKKYHNAVKKKKNSYLTGKCILYHINKCYYYNLNVLFYELVAVMSNVITLNKTNEALSGIKESIIFEHPLNETIRVCLILEQLFKQAEEDIRNIQTTSHTKHAVNTIIRIMNVTERPDLRGKLAKALSSQASILAQLESNPQVDQNKLASILNEIDSIYDLLHEDRNKFGEQLKNNKVIKAISQYSSSPGGAANFNIPSYLLWLNQNNQTKKQEINEWLAEFNLIRDAVTVLLRLTRNSQILVRKNAEQGFFQVNLEPQPVTQLIRVKIATRMNIWPEISVGRHRLAIYFKNADNSQEVCKDQEIYFELACCY
jgi:cell division protein ZapD